MRVGGLRSFRPGRPPRLRAGTGVVETRDRRRLVARRIAAVV
jgi:hypothetical protein